MLYPSPVHRVLRLKGPDALTFLQSQLTNDVTALVVGAWQWQGLCTAKGRLLATFALTRTTDDTFEAIVHTSTIDPLAKRLLMFRMRSKVAIEIMADRLVQLAFANDELSGEQTVLRLADGRAFVVGAMTTETSPVDKENVAQLWQIANIENMIPEVTSATAEFFVPQMIGWDTVQPGGGVSFGKGCYPGQEVVARAHFRGAVKRHLERLQLPGDSEIQLGEDVVIDIETGVMGTVCNAARNAHGDWVLLAVVGRP